MKFMLFFMVLCSSAAAVAQEADPASGVVFQYAATHAISDKKTVTAYLWLPPQTTTVRGVVIGGTVLFEGRFAAHPALRRVCAEHDLGIVLFSPHLDAVFQPATSGDWLQRFLDDLAQAAGHPELAQAPLLPFGHSVATIWTRNVLFWQPERCFGGIFFKGGFSVPEGRKLAEIAGIPLFHLQGRFEEFGPGPNGTLRKDQGESRLTGGETALRDLSALRAAHPDFLMGLAIEDGSTHFALNDAAAEVLAGFVVGAAVQRIADDGSLRPVPATAGALVAASASTDAATTFWHVSAEQAKQVEAFQARFHGRQPQYVSVDNGKGQPVAVGHDMRLRTNPHWVEADVFSVRGAFWPTVPDAYPPQATPVSHAEGPVQVRVMAGPLEQVAPDRFRITADRRLGDRPFVLIYHPGDATHRAAEQPVNVRAPNIRKEGKEGAAQTITWEIADAVSVADFPLALTATSTSGLPVRFHVDHGPARVQAGRLELADVPERATWPLRVTVIASQYGSAIAPQFATAPVIERTILVTR